MTDAATMRPLCSAKSITMPGGGDVHLIPPPPKPCVTIVVHGVNDMAGCYERIERGLCKGLNERLDLSPNLPNGASNPGYLTPAGYTEPKDDDGKASNPDAVYYRRKFSASSNGGATRSVIIPFYWGFREEETHINKTEPHGEWLDRNKNRLDKAGTKEGGQFANATTNLPDMWGKGFNAFPFGFIPLNFIGGNLTHPLLDAAGRRYMVLAAMRLAMLIKIIRKRYLNDTINVVGHSQGTLINLLAHAFLKDDNVRPADGVVMIDSPYSLFEPFSEKVQNMTGQQTTGARLATLKGILQFIGENANPHPALSSIALKNCQGYGAIGGPGWKGIAECEANIGGGKVPFQERDNRGSTYLYFTPQDQTVGLGNVQGIGWQGVGETINDQPARSVLGQYFHQRIFTVRKRDGKKEEIGAHPPTYVYPLLLKGEKTWEDTGFGFIDELSRAELNEGASVMLTAPKLPVPALTDFTLDGTLTAPGEGSKSGVFQAKDNLDPIDASIALSNDKSLRQHTDSTFGRWEPDNPNYARSELMSKTSAYKYGTDVSSVEKARNEAVETSQSAHVLAARPYGEDQIMVTRGETPYEARMRLQGETFREALSFHSGIPNNPEHSRQVLAYDVAIGSGESVDDVTFYAYLCRVADWRLDWSKTDGGINGGTDNEPDLPGEDIRKIYREEDPKYLNLIDSTATYRQSGILPNVVVNAEMPKLVATQTWGGKKMGKPITNGGKV